MILEKESPRTAWVVNHFVHALSELRIPMLLGHELGTDTRIACAPTFASVFRAIYPSRRHRDQHSPTIVRVDDDRVQAKPSASGLPLGLVFVIEQTLIWLPAFASVTRLEERGGLNATIENVGLCLSA
jgi:hypothetical protein